MSAAPLLKLEYTRLELLRWTSDPLTAGYAYAEDLKDPCVVEVDGHFHVYGSIGSSRLEEWQIFHALAEHRDGPWHIQPPVQLSGLERLLGGDRAPHIAAPAVVYDETTAKFQMVVQTEFMAPGGKILHLVSSDGQIFTDPKIILKSITAEDSCERGIYDPHFASLQGKKYLSYSGAKRIGPVGNRFMADPDIFLAVSDSESWSGPWRRQGMILSHAEVPHHNPRQHPDYEWGLEGSQLLELPGGYVLMVAVCFKPDEIQGLRQRIFFAAARQPLGPYKTLGIAIEPQSDHAWNSGENGHAMAEVFQSDDGQAYLRLWHQGRPKPGAGSGWTHRFADFPLAHILDACQRVL